METPKPADLAAKLETLQRNLGRVILGKEDRIELLTIALVAGGSVLIEDVPGVGKTTLAKALARSVKASFNRVQFTPDLLPADIVGGSVYNPADGSFAFRPGPVFCNVLLADEINRASPRTQSALLEAMQEKQTTIEGRRHVLPAPFMVLATENPVEFHGTYPLPEAQLDRFLLALDVGYPSAEVEVGILRAQAASDPLEDMEEVLTLEETLAAQAAARQVRVDEAIGRYIVEIVNATRQDSRLRLGVSPRGSLMLYRAAQAAAFIGGRDYALPDDVQRMAGPALAHRIVLTSKAKYTGTRKEDVVREILERTRAPT